MDNANHEKINNTCSGKALKVTEVRPAILKCLVSPLLLFAGYSGDLVLILQILFTMSVV
jgi:hypothetical protein